MSDISEFIWKGFEELHPADKDDKEDLMASMERMMEPKFLREYTVYRISHFSSRIVELDDKFQLPTNSILHIVDNYEHLDDFIDTPRVEDNIFVQREVFRKWIYHVKDINLKGPVQIEDKYILRMAGLPSRLLAFRSSHPNQFRYANHYAELPRKRESLILINHNPLFRLRLFGRLQFWRKMQLIFASILNTANDLTFLNKRQFIFIPWGDEFYDRAQFFRSRNVLNLATIRKPENLHYFFMMHILNFLWDTATTSALSKLPEECLRQLYIVPYFKGKYIFYNLAELLKLNVKNYAYRRVLNQLNLLSVLGREEAEKHPLAKKILADAKDEEEGRELEHELDRRSLDSDTPLVEPEKLPETITPVVGINPGINLTDITSIVENVGESVVEANKDVAEAAADEIKELAEATEESTDPTRPTETAFGLTRGVAGNKLAETLVTSVSMDVASTKMAVVQNKESGAVTLAPVRKVVNTTRIQTTDIEHDNFAQDYIDEVHEVADKFIDEREELTPRAKERYKRLARKYEDLEIDGEKISTLLKDNTDISISDSKLDAKQLGVVPDPSALESTLANFDKDYIKKTYKKHIAGTISAFQKEGVYLINVKTEKVVTDLHNYTLYSCQYEDIAGRKSTVKFKMPNVNSEGKIVVDGVPNVVKKQRTTLPIVKISDTTVSLASNYNKTRVIRNTNKAHNFFSYIANFINDPNKSNATITYGNHKLNLAISYEYVAIAEHYSTIVYGGLDKEYYNLTFDYSHRLQHFGGKAELLAKLENEYGIYFGTTRTFWLFIDVNNRVYAVNHKGGEKADYQYTSLIEILKLALKPEMVNKIKPLTEWVTIKILDLSIPVIFMLAYRYGLRHTLDYLGIKYTITENRSKTIVGESAAGMESDGTDYSPDIKPNPELDKAVDTLRNCCYSASVSGKTVLTRRQDIIDCYVREITSYDSRVKIWTWKDYKRVVAQYHIDEKKDNKYLEMLKPDGWACYCVCGTALTMFSEQEKEWYNSDSPVAVCVRKEIAGHVIICPETFTDAIFALKDFRCTEEFIKIHACWSVTHELAHATTSMTVWRKAERLNDYSITEEIADSAAAKACKDLLSELGIAYQVRPKFNDKVKGLTPSLFEPVAGLWNSIRNIFRKGMAIAGLESYVPRTPDDEIYFYHVIPKNNTLKQDGLMSPYAMYHHNREMFHQHTWSNYKKRASEFLRKPEGSITDEDIMKYLDEEPKRKAFTSKALFFSFVKADDLQVAHGNEYVQGCEEYRISLSDMIKYSVGKPIIVLGATSLETTWEEVKRHYDSYCRDAILGGKKPYKEFLYKYIRHIAVKFEEPMPASVLQSLPAPGVASFGAGIDNILINGRATSTEEIEDEDYSGIGDLVVGMENAKRPVKPKLGDVTIFFTNKGTNHDFGTQLLQVRAIVFTVKLGRNATVNRRLTNYDGSTFSTSDIKEVPRELVDKASEYLRCGKRKISKAHVVFIPADKSLPKAVMDAKRLSPVEYKKMTSKLNIPENKVVPPSAGNASWMAGMEDLSEDIKYVPQPNDIHIRFADRVLHFNRYPLTKSLIVAGLAEFDLSKYEMAEFESKDVYFRVLVDKRLSTNYLKGIDSFYDLFVDNMTYTVLKMMHEPTNVRDLLIRSAVLLSTTDHVSASAGTNHRIRGYEQFAAILYNELSRELAGYQARRGKANVFSINPDAVYLRIIQNASMIPAVAPSPLEDLKLCDAMTYSGVGGRTGESFVIEDRRFDESDVGIISEATADSGKVGMNAMLSFNPDIVSTMGLISDKPASERTASQTWSIHALTFPFATNDD